ncbi:MAG TPA: F0F1 ATP synthase subunit gamma, partial [Kofleriaceae bacterium]|nr:F0F1 ATP synthase subunit gamma [Kofleriaceae bacterium]
MQKLLDLRERIKALHDIRAVARTLATVSAAKLAASRRRAAGLRDYARAMEEVVLRQQASLAAAGAPLDPVLREPAHVARIALLVVTGDRGMCGGYNLAVCRAAAELRSERLQAGQQVELLFKGKKGE